MVVIIVVILSVCTALTNLISHIVAYTIRYSNLPGRIKINDFLVNMSFNSALLKTRDLLIARK